jgi:hypothetical protein
MLDLIIHEWRLFVTCAVQASAVYIVIRINLPASDGERFPGGRRAMLSAFILFLVFFLCGVSHVA